MSRIARPLLRGCARSPSGRAAPGNTSLPHRLHAFSVLGGLPVSVPGFLCDGRPRSALLFAMGVGAWRPPRSGGFLHRSRYCLPLFPGPRRCRLSRHRHFRRGLADPWPCQRESVERRKRCLEQRDRRYGGIPTSLESLPFPLLCSSPRPSRSVPRFQRGPPRVQTSTTSPGLNACPSTRLYPCGLAMIRVSPNISSTGSCICPWTQSGG